MPNQPKLFSVDQLQVHLHDSQPSLAQEVTEIAHAYLVKVLESQKTARVILATGNSQMQFLQHLVAKGGIDWARVTCFHMDEYLGIDANHRASFRRYMQERVVARVKPGAFHFLEGDCDEPLQECHRYEELLREAPIDLCCLGVGENGHIAFNDPPVANFTEKEWVKLVKLDDACKQQQVNEGHFGSLAEVNPYAFTLTIPALCAARKMLCICPEKRKAAAVKEMLLGPVSTSCPASFLRTQNQAILFLDKDSASMTPYVSGATAIQK
jgi:glucosamine-6-phosphate deaminase